MSDVEPCGVPAGATQLFRIGSLFSGSGQLDVAVQQVFGGEIVWHAEPETLTDEKTGKTRPNPAVKALEHHWPDVPNLGDVSRVDWQLVEWVEILCGGFPCQDISSAGRQAGMGEGTRSGLWSQFARAIAELRPRIVVIENVRNLLSVKANRAVEYDEATVGDGSSGPVLRALGAVLGDLCDLGYDAQWVTVSAASVGAPHQRDRVFILAADTTGNGRHERWSESARFVGGSDAAVSSYADLDLLPTPSVADSEGGHLTRSGARSNELLLPGIARAYGQGDLLRTPKASDGRRNDCPSERERNTPSLVAIEHYLPTHPDQREGHTRQLCDYALLNGSPQWGKYEPAIRRWESVTRPAPSPTEPNTKGNPRLAAAFPEWMQGWPAGWVTAVPGLSRNDQLRLIGNGVCPQQAVAALCRLLSVCEVAA